MRKARLDTMNADQLRRLVSRQRTTIARLDRIIADADKALGRRNADLRDVFKDRDAVRGDLKAARDEIAGFTRDVMLYERQGRHVKALYEAMLQRYVGVKLDAQQFSFPQAQQFMANEVGSLEHSLGSIRVQVDQELANGCSQLERRAA